MDLIKIENYLDVLMDDGEGDVKIVSACLKFIEIREKLKSVRSILDEEVD